MENLENWRKKQHLREVLLSHFFSKKTAAESHRLLVEVYGEHALSKTQCFEWFRRFKICDFDIKDKERPGQQKKFGDKDLETLLHKNPCQTPEELAESLNVNRSTISRRLKAMGMIKKCCRLTHRSRSGSREEDDEQPGPFTGTVSKRPRIDNLSSST